MVRTPLTDLPHHALAACAWFFLMLMGCGEAGSDGTADSGALQIAHPASLWSIEQLAAATDPPLLIDVRKPADYAMGHIPGARQIWRSDFTVEVDGGPALGRYGGMACSPEDLAALMDSLGARPSGQILLCDGVGGCDAARVWWLLRLYGHKEVALLDGGLPAWEASGRSASMDAPPLPSPGGFAYTSTPQPELLVTLEDVEAARAAGDVLLDTRSLAEFSGAQHKSGAARPGHIPGAVHYDWGNAVDMGGVGCLKPLKDIVHDLGNLGIRPETPVITYCHSGVRSAHTAFVLREVLGYPNVRNYDGSWTEYSRNQGNQGD